MDHQTLIWLLDKVTSVLWTFVCLSLGFWLGRRSVPGNRRMKW
jgi:hypothetical protein